MTNSTDVPRSLLPGDPVIVVPKNPLASTAVWGLFIALVNLVLQTLVAKNKLPASLQTLVGNAVVEIAVYAIGFGLALYGRWTATRPLGLTPAKRTTIMLALALAIPGLGCTSTKTPLRKALDARLTYNAVVNSIVTAKEHNLISQTDFDHIAPVIRAGAKDLDELDLAAARGDDINFNADFINKTNAVNEIINQLLDWRKKALTKQ